MREMGGTLCELAYTELDIPYDITERERIISKNFPESFMILNLRDFHSIYMLIRKKIVFFVNLWFRIDRNCTLI